MMRTTTAAMNFGKRSPHRAALSSRLLLKPRVAKNISRRSVVLRATAVQPSLDPTTELFATLSSIAAVDENGGDARPAVAFASSSSSSSSSSPSTSGRGLVATRPLARGEVALRVPGSICLVVDYSPRGSGLSLPESSPSSSSPSSVAASSSSSWPRTKAAVAKDPSTPWDFLLALALLDAVSGDGGGEWWESFAEGVLPLPSIGEEEEEEEEDEEEGEDAANVSSPPPPPSLLTLPLCLPQRLLALTGHRELEEAALEQQRRLAERYPALAIPASASSRFPTMMQWALACVRSRAFSLSEEGSGGRKSGGGGGGGGGGGSEKSEAGDDERTNEEEGEDEEIAFAFVPLLDCANHSQDPAAAYRPVWKEEQQGDGDGGKRRLEAVELVALRAVAEGEEVTISYFAGAAGATNRRLFSLYGFVPAGGNPGERVEGLENVVVASPSSSSASALDLDLFMDLLGPQVSRDIMQGKNPYLFAAIKSLPLLQTGGGGGGGGGGEEGAASSPSSSRSSQRQLALALLEKVESQILEVEEAAALQSGEKKDGGGDDSDDDAALARRAEAEAAAKGGRGAARAAVIRYRAERGALLRAARAALRLYCAAPDE